MTWRDLEYLLAAEVMSFARHLVARTKNEPPPIEPPLISDERKRLAKIQSAHEEQADGACLAFATGSAWPEMREEVRDAVFLRLNAARQLVAFLSGAKRYLEHEPLPVLSSREVALRFVLVEWWHFLGRYPWQDE